MLSGVLFMHAFVIIFYLIDLLWLFFILLYN